MDMPSFMDEDEQALYKDRMERAEPEHGGTPWDPKADKQFRPTRSPENNRFFQKFVRYVVGMFMGDPELRELYKQATLQIDEATFKRNNERLLRRLYADLRPRARKSRRTRFLELLTHHDTRVEVSRKVYHATMKLHLKHGVKVAYLDLGTKMWEFSTEIPRDSPHSDIKSRPRRHFRLDRTSNTWSFWPPAQDGDAQIASTSLPEIQDDPGDIPGDPDNEKHFEHLLNGEYRFEAAARFITTGHPFQLYKDRFRDYLHPVSKPGYASDDTAATVPGTQSEGRGHRSEGTRPQGGTEASAQGPLMDPGK